METKLTDSELIQAILEKSGWPQKTLASHLRLNQAQVSRVLNGKIRLRPLVREKAEQLLAEAEAKKNQ